MAPIKNIGHDVAAAERLRQQERLSSTRSEKAQKQGQAQESTKTGSPQDTVDISSTARQLAETRTSDTARYQELLANLEANGEKTRSIRARIDQGDFNRPEVLESVAESISNLPSFRNLAASPAASPDSRGILGAIARRIRSGDYNSDEVLDKVAINILRDIGAA